MNNSATHTARVIAAGLTLASGLAAPQVEAESNPGIAVGSEKMAALDGSIERDIDSNFEEIRADYINGSRVAMVDISGQVVTFDPLDGSRDVEPRTVTINGWDGLPTDICGVGANQAVLFDAFSNVDNVAFVQFNEDGTEATSLKSADLEEAAVCVGGTTDNGRHVAIVIGEAGFNNNIRGLAFLENSGNVEATNINWGDVFSNGESFYPSDIDLLDGSAAEIVISGNNGEIHGADILTQADGSINFFPMTEGPITQVTGCSSVSIDDMGHIYYASDIYAYQIDYLSEGPAISAKFVINSAIGKMVYGPNGLLYALNLNGGDLGWIDPLDFAMQNFQTLKADGHNVDWAQDIAVPKTDNGNVSTPIPTPEPTPEPTQPPTPQITPEATPSPTQAPDTPVVNPTAPPEDTPADTPDPTQSPTPTEAPTNPATPEPTPPGTATPALDTPTPTAEYQEPVAVAPDGEVEDGNKCLNSETQGTSIQVTASGESIDCPIEEQDTAHFEDLQPSEAVSVQSDSTGDGNLDTETVIENTSGRPISVPLGISMGDNLTSFRLTNSTTQKALILHFGIDGVSDSQVRDMLTARTGPIGTNQASWEAEPIDEQGRIIIKIDVEEVSEETNPPATSTAVDEDSPTPQDIIPGGGEEESSICAVAPEGAGASSGLGVLALFGGALLIRREQK